MKSAEVVTRSIVYTSDVHPEITTQLESFAKVIAWADENPVVWKIIRETKSAPFGRESSEYLGMYRNGSPLATLSRAAHFKDVYDGLLSPETPGTRGARDPLWQYRAHFTFAHYGSKGFAGGLFRQFDGQHFRGCVSLDYTPATLNDVLEAFLQWCSRAPGAVETREVWIDEKKVAP